VAKVPKGKYFDDNLFLCTSDYYCIIYVLLSLLLLLLAAG